MSQQSRQVAGVVEANDARTTGADVEFGDRRDAMPKPTEVGKLYPHHGRQIRENHKVVADGADGLVLMARGEGLEGTDGTALDIDEALSAGHLKRRAVRSSPVLGEHRELFADFRESEALHFADVHFDQRWFDLDREATRGGDWSRRFNRPGERAGVDGDDRFTGQRPRQTSRLPAASVVERDIRATERQSAAIGLSLAVADQE